MRPKKRILLVCPNELTASELTFKMTVWGLHVKTLHHIEQAEAAVSNGNFDLAILMPSPVSETWNSFDYFSHNVESLQFARQSNTRIYDPAKFLPVDVAMGIPRIIGAEKSPMQLRESIKVTTARKRGPKHLQKAA